MSKKSFNHLDFIIENLADKFSKIKDFDKFQDSEEGKKLFSLIVKNSSELQTFETLFLNYYIPATNKSIADSWSQISTSRYKSLLNISKDDLKENIYETIRLGYVGLFHKYESYLNSLVEAVDFLLKDVNEEFETLNINEYCKKEFKVNIYKSHHLFKITSRINYICNCIKHYDGYALKEPILQDFQHYPKTKRIEIEKEAFKNDIESLKKHCELILSQILMIGFKQITDQQMQDSEDIMTPDIEEKYKKLQANFKFVLSDFIK